MEAARRRLGTVGLLLGLLVCCVLLEVTAHRCSSYISCRACTAQQTWSGEPCRWCPLDHACHAMWSPRNPCLKRQNLKHPALCSRPTRGQYNPYDAYKLALFSAIAYADEPARCLSEVLPYDDFVVDSIISVDCDDYVFDYKKQCLAVVVVSHQRQEIIVAYRGSRGTKQVAEEILTMIGMPKIHSRVGGKVQHYFENVHRKLYDDVNKTISTLLLWFPGYSVLVTGHSLGGAVASITSAALIKDQVLDAKDVFLYTFGMPRVGNKVYAEAHNKIVRNSWRVVRGGDHISRLPRCILPLCSVFNGPYHHGQKVLYEGHFMNVHSPYTLCRGSDDSNSKCRHRRDKRGIKDIMLKHKQYFGIPIGTYCRDYILKNITNSATSE